MDKIRNFIPQLTQQVLSAKLIYISSFLSVMIICIYLILWLSSYLATEPAIINKNIQETVNSSGEFSLLEPVIGNPNIVKERVIFGRSTQQTDQQNLEPDHIAIEEEFDEPFDASSQNALLIEQYSYQGMIQNGNEIKALISNNTRQIWISQNDIIDGWELTKILPDSLLFTSNKEKFTMNINYGKISNEPSQFAPEEEMFYEEEEITN